MSSFRPAIAGLHLWNGAPAAPCVDISAWRFWALPTVTAALLLLVLATDRNTMLFLTLNHAARIFPDSLWACVTTLGDTPIVFAVLLPLVVRRPDGAAAALLAIVVASLASQGIKHWLDVLRPLGVLDPQLFEVIGPRLHSRSMPSGHTTAAFTLAALLCGYSANRLQMLSIIAAAGLIGVSRTAVGAHWPADVLGGAITGWLSGFAGLHLAAYCRACQSRPVHLFVLLLLGVTTVWLLTTFNSGYVEARWLERTVAAAALVLFLLRITIQRRQ